MSELSPGSGSPAAEAAPPLTPEVMAAPVPSVAPRVFAVSDGTALERARGLLRYVDRVLFDVEEPVEGGRLLVASTLLGEAAEALVAAVDAGWVGVAAEHAFFASLAGAPLPSAWLVIHSRAARVTMAEKAVLDVRAVVLLAIEVLDGPAKARLRRSAVRAVGFTTLVVVSAFLVMAGVTAIRNRPPAPGLLAGKPIKTSSNLGRDWGSSRLLFHTDLEPFPWAEWDLGQPTRMHEVVVSNRSDCCDERSVPLHVEVSDDRVTWKEVARRTERFEANTQIPFNEVTARYLRLRVGRSSFLHLEAVEAY